MPERDELIRRADALPPPTLGEVALFHWIAVLGREDPSRLDELVERARNKALHAAITHLHGQAENPEWAKAFVDAEIRISSAVEMLRMEMEASPPKRSKKRKKR